MTRTAGMEYPPLSPIQLGPKLVLGQGMDELLSRCIGGDEAAWNRLYAAHQDAARGFLHRLGVRGAQLDDACQEVFLEAFRYLPEFRRECSFRTWLYRLCATQARKVRARQRVAEVLSRILPWEFSSTVGDPGTFPTATEKLVDTALAQLSATEREVFVLYELEGLPGKEISEIVGCPEASVWRRLHYARKKFCGFIEATGGVA